jgi:hypothetical protein
VYVFHCEYSQKRGPELLKVKSKSRCVLFCLLIQFRRRCESWTDTTTRIQTSRTPSCTF